MNNTTVNYLQELKNDWPETYDEIRAIIHDDGIKMAEAWLAGMNKQAQLELGNTGDTSFSNLITVDEIKQVEVKEVIKSIALGE